MARFRKEILRAGGAADPVTGLGLQVTPDLLTLIRRSWAPGLPVCLASDANRWDPSRQVGTVTSLERHGDSLVACLDIEDGETARGISRGTVLGSAALVNPQRGELYGVMISNRPSQHLAGYDIAATGQDESLVMLSAAGEAPFVSVMSEYPFGLASGDYGSDEEAGYADPGHQSDGKPRYPTKEGGRLSPGRIRAAWSYINQQDNAEKYTAGQLAGIKSRIRAAARQAGVEISDGAVAATAHSHGHWHDGESDHDSAAHARREELAMTISSLDDISDEELISAYLAASEGSGVTDPLPAGTLISFAAGQLGCSAETVDEACHEVLGGICGSVQLSAAEVSEALELISARMGQAGPGDSRQASEVVRLSAFGAGEGFVSFAAPQPGVAFDWTGRPVEGGHGGYSGIHSHVHAHSVPHGHPHRHAGGGAEHIHRHSQVHQRERGMSSRHAAFAADGAHGPFDGEHDHFHEHAVPHLHEHAHGLRGAADADHDHDHVAGEPGTNDVSTIVPELGDHRHPAKPGATYPAGAAIDRITSDTANADMFTGRGRIRGRTYLGTEEPDGHLEQRPGHRDTGQPSRPGIIHPEVERYLGMQRDMALPPGPVKELELYRQQKVYGPLGAGGTARPRGTSMSVRRPPR